MKIDHLVHVRIIEVDFSAYTIVYIVITDAGPAANTSSAIEINFSTPLNSKELVSLTKTTSSDCSSASIPICSYI